jgi:hypothetical protein
MSVRAMVSMGLIASAMSACQGTDKVPRLRMGPDSGFTDRNSGGADDDETGWPPEDSGDTDDPITPTTDADGDGYTTGDGDCDDHDPDVNPEAEEFCDEVDNDCDGDVDEDATDVVVWYADHDADGFGNSEVFVEACWAPDNMVGIPGDCDDVDPLVRPDAAEMCDGIDNDCDGLVDGATSIDAVVYWEDDDGDGFGNPDEATASCILLPEHVDNDLDCDDREEDVYPDAAETCNGADDDCDGTIDEGFEFVVYYEDLDGDHRGNPLKPVVACLPPEGFVYSAVDCDDGNRWVHGDMVEFCDEIDNDCDGEIDEDVGTYAFVTDADGDGYGPTGAVSVMMDCFPGSGMALETGDCDDSDDEVHPSAWERCNGIDDDCDGRPDDGLEENDYYLDADGDGYGDPSVVDVACELPEGYSSTGGDCDDGDETVNPGIYADCEDGRDEDCDGEVDEGPDSTWYLDADGDGFGDVDETAVSCLMPDGYTDNPSDCDDGDEAVHPDARERCDDEIDGDCDGWSDELDPDCDCPDHGIIEDEDLGEATGDAVASGNNSSSDDSVTGTCGSSGGRDDVFLWTAPEDGCYTFDTDGSSYDTVLRLLDGCEGTELECDDDGASAGLTSRIQQALEEGTTLFVVVDAYSSGSSGDYRLDINYEPSTSEPTELPYDEDLGDEIGDALASGSSEGTGDDYAGSCGYVDGEDTAFLWEAPSSDCYTIDTEDSSYDTVLRLYSADGVAISCGSSGSGELDCDDDGGGPGLTSMITYTFEEGMEYVIVVDAYSAYSSGTYSLDINPC